MTPEERAKMVRDFVISLVEEEAQTPNLEYFIYHFKHTALQEREACKEIAELHKCEDNECLEPDCTVAGEIAQAIRERGK